MGADFTTKKARETAQVMTALAELCVRGTAAETGISIGWGEQDAANLDQRATGGRWGCDADLQEAVFETGDEVIGWPHTKVARRFEHGPKHSLYQYYRYAAHPEHRKAIAAGTG